jgi:hypothetical protein
MPKFKTEYRELKFGGLGKRQNRKRYLEQRRRELRYADLKKDAQIDMKNIEDFFQKRYGVSYNKQIQHLFGDKDLLPKNTHFADFVEHLKKAINSKERTLFLFPQTGQLFTFYFMRGLIEELRKRGITNLFARTIVTRTANISINTLRPKTNKPKKAATGELVKEIVEQATKIHDSTRPKKIVVVDLIDSGGTIKDLELAFTGYDLDFETLEFAEHQPLGKAYLAPGDFISKDFIGNKDLSLRYDKNPKTTREMLFFTGRFFAHTHLDK